MVSRRVIAVSLVSLVACGLAAGCTPKANQTTGGYADQIPDETVEYADRVRKKFAEIREQTTGIAAFLRTKILPDGTPICTVGDSVITVGDYMRAQRMSQAQIAAQIEESPQVKEALLQGAQLEGVKLTDVEKKAAMEAAEIEAQANGKTLDEMLKEQGITRQQLEQEAYQLVLARKVAFEDLEKHIMIDLIKRRLFVNAAIQNGFMKVATADYKKMEKNPDPVLKNAQLTDEQTRAEYIDVDLERLMMRRIIAEALSSPAETKKVLGVGDSYDERIDEIYKTYSTAEQIRFSEIFIKAPLIDSPLGPSLQKQYIEAHPQATREELEQYITTERLSAENKAKWLRERAKNGESFEELANRYSDTQSTRETRDGGDRGMYTIQQLQQGDEGLYKMLEKLKAGEVSDDIQPSVLGFHILKVTKRQPKGGMTRDDVEAFVLESNKDTIPDAACSRWLHSQYLSVPISVSPEFKKLMAGNAAGKSSSAYSGSSGS